MLRFINLFIIAIIFIGTGCIDSTVEKIMVYDLRCENLINPLGIDNTTPYLSWKMSATETEPSNGLITY